MSDNFPRAPDLKDLTVGILITNNANENHITGMTVGKSATSTTNLEKGTIGTWVRSEANINKLRDVHLGEPVPSAQANSAAKKQQSTGSYCLGDKTGDTNRGLVLVLSYEKFKDKSLNRPGNKNDVRAIEDTFAKQEFNVIVEKDKNEQETKDILYKVSTNKDYSEYPCFVLVILSHGDETGFLCQDAIADASQGKVTYKEMFEYFHQEGHPFVNKPKLFFIQACRGDKSDHGVTVQGDGRPDVIQSDRLIENKTPNINIIPTTADTFAFYASYDGYVSYRDTLSGSWFIQTLCKMIDQFGNEKHLQDICNHVGVEVSKREIKDEITGTVHKQTPIIKSNMFKQFYFYK